MKTSAAFALSLFALLSISCGPTAPPPNQSMIGIKGIFPAAPLIVAKETALAGNRGVSVLDPSLVTTVVSFSGTDGFMTKSVNNGSFNIVADRKRPAALLFVGAAGNSLGYLSLGNGMESIPLNMADSSVTSIDLQTLVDSGNVIEPSHNPVGDEIPMTASDITSYIFSNGALGSVVKAPDADGDGIVDVTTGKFYRYVIRYAVNAGSFGTDTIPTLANPMVVSLYIFEAKITDPDLNFPDDVAFNGPPGSGIESATSWLKQSFGTEGSSYCAPFITNPPIPPAGTYVVTYKDKTLTFHVPSQVEVTRYLAIPVPTVHLNTDGTIKKITLEYRLSDGSATIDPRALIQDLNVQVSVDLTGNPPNVHPYNSPNVPAGTTEFLIPESTPWSYVTGVGTGYHDVFGNQIGVLWKKP